MSASSSPVLHEMRTGCAHINCEFSPTRESRAPQHSTHTLTRARVNCGVWRAWPRPTRCSSQRCCGGGPPCRPSGTPPVCVRCRRCVRISSARLHPGTVHAAVPEPRVSHRQRTLAKRPPRQRTCRCRSARRRRSSCLGTRAGGPQTRQGLSQNTCARRRRMRVRAHLCTHTHSHKHTHTHTHIHTHTHTHTHTHMNT